MTDKQNGREKGERGGEGGHRAQWVRQRGPWDNLLCFAPDSSVKWDTKLYLPHRVVVSVK